MLTTRLYYDYDKYNGSYQRSLHHHMLISIIKTLIKSFSEKFKIKTLQVIALYIYSDLILLIEGWLLVMPGTCIF